MHSMVVGVVSLIACSLSLALPRLASAQSEPTPVTTGDAIAPPPVVAPAAPPAPPPAPAPAVTPVPPRTLPTFTRKHRGPTFELGLGFTQLRTRAPGGDAESGFGPGVALGVGWWLSDKAALSLRFNYARYEGDEYGFVYEPATTQQGYLGVAIQYWLRDRLWVSAGVGGGRSYVDSEQELGFPLDYTGVGLELRAGVPLLGNAHHSLNLQIDLTALNINAEGGTSFENMRDDFIATGVAFMLGYQYL